jgi:hypothetical protein
VIRSTATPSTSRPARVRCGVRHATGGLHPSPPAKATAGQESSSVLTVEGQHASKVVVFIAGGGQSDDSDLTTASRQSDKATAGGNQAGQASADDGPRDGSQWQTNLKDGRAPTAFAVHRLLA